MDKDKEVLKNDYFILLLFPVIFFILGIILGSPTEIVGNLRNIILEPSVLLTDYLVVGGLSGTFINAALVSFFAIFLLYKSKKEIDGLTIASILTIFGFSFIGKNFINVLPIYLGGYLYSKYAGEDFKDCIVVLIFATTLAPFVSEIMFTYPLDYTYSIVLGILMGMLIGFIVVPIGRQMSKLHEGYNLYNIGFTGGMIGVVIVSIYRGFGMELETRMVVSTEYHKFLMLLLGILFLGLILLGYLKDRGAFEKYRKLTKETGLAPNDFKKKYGEGTVFINMGIMGLISMLYVLLCRGSYNGPTVAGIFTVVGFSASGKHKKNSIPILLGVFLASLVSKTDPSSDSAIIAGLFGTTLAPIAGDFGFLAGIVAGFLHILIGSNILAGHGGLNLYNNGFTGGIVAAVLLPIYRTIRNKREGI